MGKKDNPNYIHPFKGRPIEFQGHNPETCKCAACRAKRGEFKGKNNAMYGKRGKDNPHYGRRHTPEARKNMKEAQLKRKEQNPEAWIEMSKKGAKTTQEKYPNLFINSINEFYEEHPDARRQVAIERNRRWKEQEPDDYYEKKRHYVQLMIEARQKNKQENPEEFHRIRSRLALERIQERIKNSPYMWKDVGFLSKEELKCAKLLLNTPIDGVNCNVKIGRKIIDFFPQIGDKKYIGCFVEYHPWDWDGLSEEEYYNQRRNILNDSSYNDIPLVIITNLNELKEEPKNGREEGN